MYRFIMKQYSHNAKLCVYAIAVVYNLVSASSTVAQNHLSLLAGHVDMLNLIFSKGLPEDKGMWCNWNWNWKDCMDGYWWIEASSLASSWISLFVELLAFKSSEEHPVLRMAINTLETSSYDLVSPAQLLFLFYLLDSSDSNTEFRPTECCCQDLLGWMHNQVLRSHTVQEIDGRLCFDIPRLEKCKEETEEGKKLVMMIEAMGCCLSLVAGQASECCMK